MSNDFKERERQKLLETRDKTTVEAVPKKPDFFEWLERLFTPEQFPEKIEVRVVSGRNFERLGPMIKQLIYPPKAVKPSREEIVSLSNELIFLMQRDCDVQRKSIVYGAHVSHFSRDTDFYERWLIRCHPSPLHSAEGVPRHDPDDDEGHQKSTGDQFAGLVLQHHERLFALYGGGFEGLLDRFDRVLERQEVRIAKQDDRVEKLTEMLERALSLEAERAERRQWNELKARSVEKALDLGMSLAPPLLNQLMGKKVVEGQDTPETITLKQFFKKKSDGGQLTEEQANLAFGTEDGKPGVLSFEQARILWDVAHCHISPDELDNLLPGGKHPVTVEQVMALQQKCGFSMEQLAPISVLIEARLKRRGQIS